MPQTSSRRCASCRPAEDPPGAPADGHRQRTQRHERSTTASGDHPSRAEPHQQRQAPATSRTSPTRTGRTRRRRHWRERRRRAVHAGSPRQPIRAPCSPRSGATATAPTPAAMPRRAGATASQQRLGRTIVIQAQRRLVARAASRACRRPAASRRARRGWRPRGGRRSTLKSMPPHFLSIAGPTFGPFGGDLRRFLAAGGIRLGEARRIVGLGLDAGEDLVDALGEAGELLGGESARGFGDGRSTLLDGLPLHDVADAFAVTGMIGQAAVGLGTRRPRRAAARRRAAPASRRAGWHGKHSGARCTRRRQRRWPAHDRARPCNRHRARRSRGPPSRADRSSLTRLVAHLA